MTDFKTVGSYNELKKQYDYKLLVHARFRNAAVFAMSLFSKIDSKKDWVRFLNYHHIFADERKDFARQIRYLKNFGDYCLHR